MCRIFGRPNHRKGRYLCLLIAVTLMVLFLPSAAAAVDAGRVIRVGDFENGGSGATAYDREYLQALAQYTGWKYEYVSGTWSECLDMLSRGELDLLGFVSKTAEREKLYGYPNLPMAVGSAWLVTDINSSLELSDLSALDGIRVGVVRNNAYNDDMEEYCRDSGVDAAYREYASLADIAPALAAAEIDAAVVSFEDMTESERGLLKLSNNNQYYVTNKLDTELLAELDEAMQLVNTYYPYLNNDLYQRYLSEKANGIPVFSAEEQDFIKNNPVITVLIDAGWPPVEYYDEENDCYSGIFPDLFDLLSKKTGLTFAYEGTTSGDLLAQMASKERKNLLTPISFDYGWAEQHSVYITQPFSSSQIVKLGRNLDSEHPIAAINKDAYFTYALREELVGVETLSFPKQAQRLEAVRQGYADYTFVTEDQANYYRSMPKYSDLEIQSMLGYEQKVCICIGKNSDPELLRIISRALNSVTHDEQTAILRSNTLNSYEWTLWDFLYAYRAPLIVIILLLLLVLLVLFSLAAFRKRSERKLKAAYDETAKALVAAEQASAAKGNFMSRMSHEIRTPLNAIIGYNTIAAGDIAEAKSDAEFRAAVMKVSDCLAKSNIASKHLLTVINDVLDMSAIESGKIQIAHEKFDFKGLINSLTTIFYSQARAKGVELEVLFDTLTEEWFVGDSLRLNQILTNILSNAVKFTPEGGSVTVVIRQPEAQSNAAHIHFEITDTGIGMAPDYLEHIWTPFEQADSSISRRFGGTGLGLSITKNLVDLMNGTIEVESEQGRGTTFRIELTFERTEQPSGSASYDFSSINALVVDDDASTGDYVSLLMSRFGARCFAVTSGSEAVAAVAEAERREEPYSLCLVDWKMPKLDGIETVKLIREVAGADIPIIVVTAYDFSEVVDRAAEAGITKFLSKPLFQSSLFNLLANIIGLQPESKIDKAPALNLSGRRVLLVEDNEMNMEIARRILESIGLIVDSAWNGEEARNLFCSSTVGTYQLILMDVQMPVMDGYSATIAIRSSEHPEAKSVPIIAMTADAFAENVAEALASGMNDHISKPIDLTTLYDTLNRFIGK